MSEQWLEAAIVLIAVACFAAGVWGTRGHFVIIGRLPTGMWLINGLSFIGALWFFARIATAGLGWGAPYALCLMVASFALFWWSVTTTRTRRPHIAFTDKQPQLIIGSGPYRFVRHPFYVSYLLCWIATGMATPGVGGYVVPFLMAVLYVYLAIREERGFRSSDLAEEYQRYRECTGMFVPRIRSSA